MELSNFPVLLTWSPLSPCVDASLGQKESVCPPLQAAKRKLVSFPPGLVAAGEKILPRGKWVVAATEEEKRGSIHQKRKLLLSDMTSSQNMWC